MLRTDDAGRRTVDAGRWTLDSGPSTPYYKLTGELKKAIRVALFVTEIADLINIRLLYTLIKATIKSLILYSCGNLKAGVPALNSRMFPNTLSIMKAKSHSLSHVTSYLI